MSPRLLACIATLCAGAALAGPAEDEATVARLDREYQLAVKTNDAATIARIHADDMILILGNGRVVPGREIEGHARAGTFTFEAQDEEPGSQKVRVWGDTAVVTALLHLKGTGKDRPAFDYKLWFSDTYVRTPSGWRYVLGQASMPLPKDP